MDTAETMPVWAMSPDFGKECLSHATVCGPFFWLKEKPMMLRYAGLATMVVFSFFASAANADDGPQAQQAVAPAAAPKSETIGVRISKLTRNSDGTILAIFDTKDRQGNTIPREVLITPDTIVNIGGQLKNSSDIKDEMIKDVVVAMVGQDGRTAILLRWGRVMLNVTKEDLKPAQFAALQAVAPKATAESDAAVDKRIDEYVAALHLNAPQREARVKNVLRTNLRAVRDAHNAWIMPSKGVREELNKGLSADLTAEQIDQVKDMLTSNNIRRHYIAYHVIVPGLTKEEDEKIMEWLKEAREDSLDIKNVRDMGRTFEPYKNQIEAYLISRGHDWKALYKENASKVGQVQAKAASPD